MTCANDNTWSGTVNLPSNVLGTSLKFVVTDTAPNLMSATSTYTGIRVDNSQAVATKSITLNGGDVAIGIDGCAGETYQLERKLSLTDASWQVVATVTPTTCGALQLTDPGSANQT